MRWSQQVHDHIISELETGRTITSICRDPGMPTRRAVYKWIKDENNPMHTDYRVAREIGLMTIGDQLIELSDEADEDNYNAIKVRLDTRKWVLSKLLPKQFGERTEVNHSGSIETKHKLPSDRELSRILAQISYETGQPLMLEAESVEQDSGTDGARSNGEMQDRAQAKDASETS